MKYLRTPISIEHLWRLFLKINKADLENMKMNESLMNALQYKMYFLNHFEGRMVILSVKKKNWMFQYFLNFSR